MKVNLIKKNSQKHRKSLREKQFLNNTEPSEQNLDADLQPDHSQAKKPNRNLPQKPRLHKIQKTSQSSSFFRPLQHSNRKRTRNPTIKTA